MSIIVRKHSSKEAYLSERFHFFKKVEGAVPRVYSDSKGIPTVGVGYALLVEQGKKFVVRDGWKQDFQNAGVDFIGVDMAVPDRLLTEIAGILNNGGDDAVSKAQAIIKPWSSGEDSSQLNAMGLPLLNDEQMENLFNQIVNSYQKILSKKIGDGLVAQWDQSREMIALLSLTYNNPRLIGPGLTRALQSGNRPEAWYEIRDNSNGGKSNGIAKRRYFESFTFGLYNDRDNVGTEEAQKVLEMAQDHKSRIDGYEAQFQRMISSANTDYGLKPPNVIQTFEEELKPARTALKD